MDVVERSGARAATEERVEFRNRLRADIVEGRYSPNERLVEADLAERYGVRRGVVRIVLTELEQERLIVRILNRGARVRAITTEEVVEITEARLALEGLCAAKAADRGTEEDFKELKTIVKQMQAAFKDGDVLRYNEALHHLHHAIRTASKHAVGKRVAEQLRDQGVRHLFGELMGSGAMAVSLRDHKAIVQAIVSRDSEAARQSVQALCDDAISSIVENPQVAPLRRARA
jgi:DNA-binding GntR family transcriptional regulator